jgi:cytochrome P450
VTDVNDLNRAVYEAREYNPYTTEFLDHEFETYDLLRAKLPIARSEAAGPTGTWVLTRYDQSCEFLQNAATFSNQVQDYPVRPWIPQAIDPPMHSSYRRIMNPWFTVDAMRALEPHLEKFADELIDKMLQSDRFDFVAELADPFPTVVFCELAGFPLEDYEQIMDWKNTLMHPSDGHTRGYELAATLGRELGLDVPEAGPLPAAT